MELFRWYVFENNDYPVMPIFFDRGRYVCIQVIRLVEDKIRLTATSMETDIEVKVVLDKENKRESIMSILADIVYF